MDWLFVGDSVHRSVGSNDYALQPVYVINAIPFQRKRRFIQRRAKSVERDQSAVRSEVWKSGIEHGFPNKGMLHHPGRTLFDNG